MLAPSLRCDDVKKVCQIFFYYDFKDARKYFRKKLLTRNKANVEVFGKKVKDKSRQTWPNAALIGIAKIQICKFIVFFYISKTMVTVKA